MTQRDDGPGVPEAIPRTLQGVVERLGATTLDRLWIFPPRIRGRKESGLVVVSCFADNGDVTQRRLFTASYGAERTGKGITLEWSLSEEGAAPPDRLPPVMEGVVRRAGDESGEAREVALTGSVELLRELLAEWALSELDSALWPVVEAVPEEDEDSEVPEVLQAPVEPEVPV